jgi:hypothetical protein
MKRFLGLVEEISEKKNERVLVGLFKHCCCQNCESTH